ncbi:MAG: DMT family transporter [Bacteroidia bacterium]|nr:DMT family transporter [Bacteroidia bacterium]
MDLSGIPFAGEAAAVLTTISWTICIFPFTAASRKLGAGPLNHFRLLLACTILTILLLVFSEVPSVSVSDFTGGGAPFWFFISGVIGLALGDYFGFSGFAILGPRVGSVFTTLAPIATLFAGWFLVGERINPVGLLGITVTILSVTALSFSKAEILKVKESGHGKFRHGVFYLILSSSCQGIGLVLANKGFSVASPDSPDPVQATWMRMVAGTVVIFFLTIVSGKLPEIARPVLQNRQNGNWYALAGTLFGPVAGVMLSMLAVSLLKNQPSIAQTIFSLLPVMALPVNYMLYREKVGWKQVAVVAGACGGVIILVWRDAAASLFLLNFAQ